jgi:biopolymer transport protein TolQ
MDIPVLNMILRSGWVAKLILLLLVFSSFISWGIIANRFFYLSATKKMNRKISDLFKKLNSINDIKSVDTQYKNTAMGSLSRTGLSEYNRILEDAKVHSGVTDWSFYLQNQFYMVQERLAAEVGRLSRKQDWGLYLLAVISSSAPFMGLLGTVWGIMNAFYDIGNQGSASLAVVAPGIAEALITTIAGLIVAIPAVIFYNIFLHKVERIEDELDEFSDHLFLRLKRELFNLLYTSKKINEAPVNG